MALARMDKLVKKLMSNPELPVQSVPIFTNVVSSNPARGEVYSIQPHVIKFVGD